MTKPAANNLLDKATSIMAKDKSAKTKTVDKRWTYIFKGLDPSAALTTKFMSVYKETKQNKGNSRARGLDIQDQDENDEQIKDMLALGKKVPFWARLDGSAKEKGLALPKVDKKKSPHVFDQLTYLGIKNRLQKTKSKLKCNHVKKHAIYSQNNGFALFQLLDK